MAGPARPATYDDLVRLPENLIGELLDGELIASPRPSGPHSGAAFAVAGELHGPFQRGRGGPGGWIFGFEPELHLGSDVMVPDLAGWRIERLAKMPSAAVITVAPDWVCEVLSPSTERIDRGRKLRLYARHGVSFIWLLDPLNKLLEVYRLEREHWVLLGTHDGDAARAEPFADVELDLLAFWGERR